MDDVSVNTLFKLGLVAGAGYIAYLLYNSLKAPAAAIASAADAATTGAANLIVSATHTASVASGNVSMPNGMAVPVASMSNLGFDSNGVLVFQYAGTNYAISSLGGGAYAAAPYGYSTLQGLPRRRGLR
jgi:hypothetical protein